MIDNTEWLRGYRAYGRGEGIPWGCESARRGWLEAKRENQAGLHRAYGLGAPAPIISEIPAAGA